MRRSLVKSTVICGGLVAMLTLAACRDETAEVPAGVEPAQMCPAAAQAGLIGQPASVLETMRFADPVRILRPGTAMTMDYRAERMNIYIDADEKIEKLTCG
jgi:hypothetical protein